MINIKSKSIVHRTVFYRSISPYSGMLKIVFLTDLHYMPSRRSLYKTAQHVAQQEKPDLLIFGGDFIDHRKQWDALRNWLLQFPGNIHKFAVPGNWEYYDDETSVRFAERMNAAGITALCNENVSVTIKGQRLHIAGVDDYHNGMPSVQNAFSGIPEDEFCIGVSHSPDVIDDLDEKAGCNLMLCGHTHGGQFRIPGFGAVVTNTRVGKRYECGLYQLAEDRFAYVSRGMGEGMVKLRFHCPHEITVLTLKHRWPKE